MSDTSNCTASLHPAVWVLRLHEVGGFGAPYVGSATVLDRGEAAEIVGLTVQGDYTRGHRAAVFKALLAAGYRWAEWDRRTAAGLRRIRKRL